MRKMMGILARLAGGALLAAAALPGAAARPLKFPRLSAGLHLTRERDGRRPGR